MPTPFVFRGYVLKPDERKLLRGSEPVALGARALDVLLALVQRQGGLVTKEELLQLAWPGLVVEEGNVHVQISQLRKLLGADAIATVAGLGYRFAWPLEETAEAMALRARQRLPAARTPFIGREAVLAEAARTLASTRLLTLAGIGGTGKTRLALRLAEQVADRFRDGAVWVDLAPLDAEQSLVPTVALALAATLDSSMPPTQALCALLRDRETLLVLDNCEHLLDAVAALVDALLAASPGLVVLATSREALAMAGELALSVRPLLLPPPGAHAAELEANEAVQLFVQGAQQATPGFRLDEGGTADAVSSICRQLDGIPLALELAAAQLKVVSPAQLSQLLLDHFLLFAGPRRALARQQTLHAVIQWSHDQLSASEKAMLGALAVCRGGCDLSAAAALVAPKVSQAALLSGLSRLSGMSLLAVSQPEGEAARYVLLETVRHFALAHLQASGEAAAARERHAAHYLSLAEAHDAEVMRDGAGASLLRRLALEHDNLLQALAWFEREGGGAAAARDALRLVAALRHYWSGRGLMRLGRDLTLAVFERSERTGASPFPTDRTLFWALAGLAQLHRFLGDAEAALPWMKRCLAVAETLADFEALSVGEGILAGAIASLGRLDEAHGHLERSLAHARSLGSARRIADSQSALARLSHTRGHTADALARMEGVLEVRRVDGNAFKLVHSLCDASGYLIEFERLQEARERLLETLKVLPMVGSAMLQLRTLDAVAAWLSPQQHHARAVELLGAVQAALAKQQLEDDPADRPRRLRAIEAARRALGESAFAAALSVGESASLLDALSKAERWIIETRPPTRASALAE